MGKPNAVITLWEGQETCRTWTRRSTWSRVAGGVVIGKQPARIIAYREAHCSVRNATPIRRDRTRLARDSTLVPATRCRLALRDGRCVGVNERGSVAIGRAHPEGIAIGWDDPRAERSGSNFRPGPAFPGWLRRRLRTPGPLCPKATRIRDRAWHIQCSTPRMKPSGRAGDVIRLQQRGPP